MTADHERAPLEATRRSPFWICLVVFAALAVDAGFRLAKVLDQRQQLERARLNQAVTVGRLSNALAQTPQLEAKLQAISVDLIQLGRTNATAAQLIREFNIAWTPGKETAAPTSSVGTNLPVAATNSALPK